MCQMKSELHNATKEIQMAQSLHNEKERSLREIQAKIATGTVEKVRAQQSMQEAKRLMQMQQKGKTRCMICKQNLTTLRRRESRPSATLAAKAISGKMNPRPGALYQAGSFGDQMDEKTAVSQRKGGRSYTCRGARLETEVSQMKSELHNAERGNSNGTKSADKMKRTTLRVKYKQNLTTFRRRESRPANSIKFTTVGTA